MARAFGNRVKRSLDDLDGAHNPHAIKALLATLQERFADYRKEILFTCSKQALEDMLDLLEQIPDTELTLTHFDDSRATDESSAGRGS